MYIDDPDEIVDLWIAAMRDAACGNLNQLQISVSHPKTGKPVTIRVIVVPERMAMGGVGSGKSETTAN